MSEVTLSGRTLYKDGKWNTLCLPFNFTAEQIAAHTDFAGAKLMELNTNGTNGFDATNGTLYLAFRLRRDGRHALPGIQGGHGHHCRSALSGEMGRCRSQLHLARVLRRDDQCYGYNHGEQRRHGAGGSTDGRLLLARIGGCQRQEHPVPRRRQYALLLDRESQHPLLPRLLLSALHQSNPWCQGPRLCIEL